MYYDYSFDLLGSIDRSVRGDQGIAAAGSISTYNEPGAYFRYAFGVLTLCLKINICFLQPFPHRIELFVKAYD